MDMDMNDPLGHVGADRIALGQTTGNATLDALAIASGAASMSLVIEWVILAGIALFFTSLRTFARARVMGLRGFKWDDFLVWVALIAYCGLTVDVYIISVSAGGLANDSMPPERREQLARDGEDSLEVQLRSLGAKAQLIKWLLYALVLWLLKSSLLHFFAVRLTDGMRGAKLRAWISAGLLFFTWAATVASVFVTCRPFKMMWQIFPDPGIICQPAISPVLISVFLSCNIFTDIYLISLPIPVLIRAPLRKSQKLSLISLFSCNILITGIALTRAILMLKDPKHNSNGMWAIRETFVALITTNLPPIAPLIRRFMSPCLGRMENSSEMSGESQEDKEMPPRKGSPVTLPRRSTAVERLSRKPSMAGHNTAMANRYFSGFNFGSQVNLAGATAAQQQQQPDYGSKMQTYDNNNHISAKDQEKAAENEWDAFQGLTAPPPRVHAGYLPGAATPSPGLIIQRPFDDPPAYGYGYGYGDGDGVDGHHLQRATSARHIV